MKPGEIFCGEDFFSAPCAGADIQRLTAYMRSSGIWEEVVPGMADITVRYDPVTLRFDDARQQFEKQFSQASDDIADAPAPSPIRLAACCDSESAPDTELVAEALDISPDDLPEWLLRRRYRVCMMGFQPGFAYLEDLAGDDLPVIPRLETPRQRVVAGSIGFLGNRACIYAHDGPGGWPIIGRVREKLFDAAKGKDAILLAPGQPVHFTHGD